MADKVVLAYSGGLDTSVAIRWLRETYGLDTIALTIDVGAEKDISVVAEKARKIGAVKAVTVDARRDFLQYFVWPALQANALYEGVYPLATALARPLIAKLLVDVARQEGAVAVAHGCTGKGNDQVRFDVSIMALAPDLKIIAPVREWKMTRDAEIEYAAEHGIPVAATSASPYSVDANLWGRSVEAGVLEDPWAEPPNDVWDWTADPDAPVAPVEVTITFEQGVPVALDGETLDPVTLVQRLNLLAGAHGVGRIDMIENRLVGIKSREVYETPAATTLITAHKAIESLTLSRDQARVKEGLASEYGRLIYNGQWYSAMHADLLAFIRSSQRFVSGEARVKLHQGQSTVVGRRSQHSLYQHALATYERGDMFNHDAALGFIELWGLPIKTQAQTQLLAAQPGGQAMAQLTGGTPISAPPTPPTS
ncbi:MAG TPA: argininosuccinate synthase, partial [Ktedonobacterales bacterium]|nr:argininosuccinate synthase [Ktedonobacterales bacterium]